MRENLSDKATPNKLIFPDVITLKRGNNSNGYLMNRVICTKNSYILAKIFSLLLH